MRVTFAVAVTCALMVRGPAPGHSTAPHSSTDQIDNSATEGRLVTRVGKQVVDFPLEHTDVRIRVDGYLADATVTQTFRNPYQRKIEAVYLFPLPTSAAVNQMAITIGDRTVKGQIHRRGQAKRIYQRAKQRGFVAALLTQERPNLFTQAVANIEPGEKIEVTLRYVQPLEYEEGGYELVFPMVAGPRYLPKSSSRAGDAEAVQPAVLPPAIRSSHEISLAVEIDAGVAIKAIDSPSHQLEVTAVASRQNLATVAIGAGDSIPNKDFILRYQVAGENPEFALLAHRDGGVGSFFLLAQPPAAARAITPRELIFVLDTSSSMAGAPIDKARELIRRVLTEMRPDDTFQIVRFDDQASALGPRPIGNKPRNLGYTLDWLAALPVGGGTEMVGGIEAALAVPHDPARLRIVVFITDGYVGNEDEILALVGNQIGESRLFSFGVGSAVNRYLLEEMAELGRGAVDFVRPDEETEAAVAGFFRRIDRPLLTDIEVDWHGLKIADAVPAAIPDLFAGQPMVLSGHYTEPGQAVVTIRGRQGGRVVSFELPVVLPAVETRRPAVATVWARSRISELSRDYLRRRDPAIEAEITDLALAHQLLSQYTAFVAVDESRVTGGGDAERVTVPVEVPEGVRSIPAIGGVGGGGFGGLGVMGSGAGGGYGDGYGYGVASSGSSGYGTVASYSFAGAGSNAKSTPQVRIGTAVVLGSLDKSIIRRYVRAKLAKIRYCYEKQLVSQPGLAGIMTAEFTIDEHGAVIAATATGLGATAVEACIVQVLESIKFPAVDDSDGLVVVRYPFDFAPSEEARREQARREELEALPSPVPEDLFDDLTGASEE